MKVAIFLPSGNLGGAEQVLVQIANYYAAKGEEVTVIVLTKHSCERLRKKLDSDRMQFKCFNSSRESTGMIRFFLSSFIHKRKYSFDFLFSSHVLINAFAAVLRKWHLIKAGKHVVRESTLIFRRFNGFKLTIFNAAYDIGYHNVDLIICQTDVMKAELIKNKPGISSIKMQVLNNPVTPLKDQCLVLNPYPGKHYIVSAGRLINEKGFDLLISAYAKLLEEYPYLELVILGEGPKRSELEKQVASLGLLGRVHLLGWREDVYSYFKFADACIVSSRIEGFPNVLLQMMMVNNAVVSTVCASGIDKIKGIVTCAIENKEILTEAIRQVLTEDATIKRALFDSYLGDNNIECYVKKIEQYIGKFN